METKKNNSTIGNGSKQFEQQNENRLDVNDYPLDFELNNDKSCFDIFDGNIRLVERDVVYKTFDESIMIMEKIYKEMELYYRIKLLRKTIKEQIEDGKA